ncbi:MAG: hypothetical protein WA209_07180 [Candidatus Acidiferrales bacterium]
MLVAAFMLVISVAAMVQFAVFTWRAGLLRLAAEPLAGEAGVAEKADNLLNQNDFADASTIQEICPALSATSAASLTPVRLYHSLLSVVNSIGAAILPTPGEWLGWTEREMALCTRYSNVVLSRRLEQNQRAADLMRSY